MYSALNSDLSDRDVIIKLDVSNAFNVLCRRLTLDVLGGKASCDYACGLKRVTILRLFAKSCAICLNTSKRCAPPNPTCVTSTFEGTCLTPGARLADSKGIPSR